MKSVLSITTIALILTASSLPASAGQITGPRGGIAIGTRAVVPNRLGGYNGYGQGTVVTSKGGSVNGQIRFQTNGKGSGTYSVTGTATNQNGQTVNVTTTGSGTYDPNAGYSGQNTTTINNKTYNSSTQNGTTTITNPSGGTRTFARPRR